MFGWGWLQKLATAYVELFRNTPLLIQLYLYYRGLQSIGITLEPEVCGILALSLYTGAYLTEVFRSGIQSIPSQQMDGALALGLNRIQAYLQVLLPQSLRIILPPLGNQLISLTKNSSLVAFITVQDLFLVVYKGAVDEFRPAPYFLEGALIYMSIALFISAVIWIIEQCLPGPRQRFRFSKAGGETI
jgi:polar amino acid transport system permease protein